MKPPRVYYDEGMQKSFERRFKARKSTRKIRGLFMYRELDCARVTFKDGAVGSIYSVDTESGEVKVAMGRRQRVINIDSLTKTDNKRFKAKE